MDIHTHTRPHKSNMNADMVTRPDTISQKYWNAMSDTERRREIVDDFTDMLWANLQYWWDEKKDMLPPAQFAKLLLEFTASTEEPFVKEQKVVQMMQDGVIKTFTEALMLIQSI